MKNPVYETMTRWEGRGYTIRIWANHPRFQKGPHVIIRETLDRWRGDRLEEMVHQLCDKFPEIAAIEVLDRAGDGALHYPDWN